jgi:hypothetical protein
VIAVGLFIACGVLYVLASHERERPVPAHGVPGRGRAAVILTIGVLGTALGAIAMSLDTVLSVLS